jgi:hypothetical protein
MTNILKFLGFDTGPIRAADSLSLALNWGWAGFALLLLVLMPIIFYLYRFEDRKLKISDRRMILGLRFAFTLLFALMLAGPAIILNGWVPQKNKIAVMIDNSRSMSIEQEGQKRFDMVKKLFSEKDFTKSLKDKTGIMPDFFSFSDTVSPISVDEIENFNLEPTGDQTNISQAAADIVGNMGEGSLLGLIVLTDGVHTTGENPVIGLNNLRTPVYFLGPGQQSKTKDLSINISRPPATGYLNSSVRVTGTAGNFGTELERLKINVFRNDEPFTETEAIFKKGRNRAEFSLTIPCDKEGVFRYEFKIPEIDKEITTDNNKAGFLLKVVRERLNVLMIAGQPSWETKFIINALSTDPNAGLVAWTRLTDDRWICNREFKLQKGQRRPTIGKDFKEADVLVLKNAPYNFIKEIEKELANRLETGNIGLMLLPGTRSLSELGYQDTEIEKLLPVRLNEEKWRGTPGNMLLPSSETPVNFLRLVDDPIENVEFFATLPKFDGLYDFGKPRVGAEILISSTVRKNSDALPFLLRNRIGQGNILLFSGGPLWPAGFRLVSSNRGMAPYTALMVNMFKWLSGRREDSQVSIDLPSARGVVGKPTTIKVWVSNARHQLQSGAQVSLIIDDEKDSKTTLSCLETSEKGCYEATFVPTFNRIYKIEARAVFQGRELGKTTTDLLVEKPTSEYDDPSVKIDMMQQIASETGGIYADIKNHHKITAAIDSIPGQKLESRILDMRDSWLILLLLLALPVGEWYLRRIRGLS